MTRTLILDLDGTLVDSVPDLAAALNRLMVARRLAAFDHEATALMVGDGARALVDRAFAARGLAADEDAQASFLADYSANAAVRTRPFPGAEAALRGQACDAQTLDAVANAVKDCVEPNVDLHASAELRHHLLDALVRRTCLSAWQRSLGETA